MIIGKAGFIMPLSGVSITAKRKAFMNMILLAQKMFEKDIMQKLQAELLALCQITINAILYFFSLLHFPAICV